MHKVNDFFSLGCSIPFTIGDILIWDKQKFTRDGNLEGKFKIDTSKYVRTISDYADYDKFSNSKKNEVELDAKLNIFVPITASGNHLNSKVTVCESKKLSHKSFNDLDEIWGLINKNADEWNDNWCLVIEVIRAQQVEFINSSKKKTSIQSRIEVGPVKNNNKYSNSSTTETESRVSTETTILFKVIISEKSKNLSLFHRFKCFFRRGNNDGYYVMFDSKPHGYILIEQIPNLDRLLSSTKEIYENNFKSDFDFQIIKRIGEVIEKDNTVYVSDMYLFFLWTICYGYTTLTNFQLGVKYKKETYNIITDAHNILDWGIKIQNFESAVYLPNWPLPRFDSNSYIPNNESRNSCKDDDEIIEMLNDDPKWHEFIADKIYDFTLCFILYHELWHKNNFSEQNCLENEIKADNYAIEMTLEYLSNNPEIKNEDIKVYPIILGISSLVSNIKTDSDTHPTVAARMKNVLNILELEDEHSGWRFVGIAMYYWLKHNAPFPYKSPEKIENAKEYVLSLIKIAEELS